MLYQTAFDNPLSPEAICCFFSSGFFACWVFLYYSSEELFITAAQNQLREGELTLFRDWCEYVCFAHILSDKLNVQKIRRPF